MKGTLRLGLVLAVLILGLAPSATFAAPSPYTCTGGVVPPGTYSTLTIDGFCAIPTGTVVVMDGLIVKPGAFLDATSTAAHVDVYHGVWVGPGAFFAYGCSPSLCEDTTSDTISGGIVAEQPLGLVVHGNIIKGHVSLQGGGGGFNCDPIFPDGPPAYSTFENNTISGGVTVSGYVACWLGFIRNDVSGAVSFTNNNLFDPDAIEIVTNTIRGSLACSGNSDVLFGDSGGAPNQVTGRKTGQCEGL
jgi:hypothetical protein